MSKIESLLRTVTRAAGKLAGWLALLLVLATVGDVFLRYMFQAGSVAVQELEWHLFALIFLLGSGYCYDCDAQVRVDIIYNKFGARGKAAIDLLGDLLFLLPFCVLVVWTSIPFVIRSWEVLEGSPDPGGLPLRFLIKAAIPLGFILLALSALSSILRNTIRLARRGTP